MEIKTEVKVFEVDFKCPVCKTGYLRPTGSVLTSYPPQLPHKCNNADCDFKETFRNITYPYIAYEKIYPPIYSGEVIEVEGYFLKKEWRSKADWPEPPDEMCVPTEESQNRWQAYRAAIQAFYNKYKNE